MLSFPASRLMSVVRTAASALVGFVRDSFDVPGRKYRPETHYMRGPGPKWREKHMFDITDRGA